MSRKNTVSIPQTAPSVTSTTVPSTTSGDHQSLPRLSTGHAVQTSTVSETATPLTQSTSSYLTPSQSMAAARPLSITSGTTSNQTLATGTTNSVTSCSQIAPDQSLPTSRPASRVNKSSPEEDFPTLSFEPEDFVISPFLGGNNNNGRRKTTAMSSGLYTPPPHASPAREVLLRSSRAVFPLASPIHHGSPLAAFSSQLDPVIAVSEACSSQAEQSSTTNQTVDIGADIDSVTHCTQETRVRVHAERDKMWGQVKEESSPAPSLMGSASEASSGSLSTSGTIGISLEDSLASDLLGAVNETEPVDIPGEFFAMGGQDIPHTEQQGSPSLSLSAASDDNSENSQVQNPTTVTQRRIPPEDLADKTNATSANASPPSLRQERDSESPLQFPVYAKGLTPPEPSTTVPTAHETRDATIRLTGEQSASPHRSDTMGISESGTGRQDIVALAIQITGITPSSDVASHDQSMTPAPEKKQSVPTQKNRSSRRKTAQKKQRLGFECSLCPAVLSSFDAFISHHKMKHTDYFPFLCDICGKGFKSQSNLLTHRKLHSGKRPFKCDICGKCFKWKSNLYQHKKIHSDLKPFQCNICGTGFTLKSDLKRHKATHSDQKSYQCDICGKGFTLTKYLKEHKKKNHREERPFQCDICGKSLTSKWHLSSHKTTHSDLQPFQCNICGKGFNWKSSLRRHKAIHSEQIPFKCEICGKVFKLEINLSEHKASHSEQRPFQCNICGIAFKQTSHLIQHKKTHSDEKPFQCDICLKEFKWKYNLNQHKIIHSNKKPFQCDICLKEFKWKYVLNQHKKTHKNQKDLKNKRTESYSLSETLSLVPSSDIPTIPVSFQQHTSSVSPRKSLVPGIKKPFHCEFCGKGFKWANNLSKHKATHNDQKPFECEFCGKGFKWKDNLNQHQTIHSDQKPFKCEFCGKGFKRKDYLNKHKKTTHSDQKTFECEFCGKGFKQKDYLNKHKKTTHSDQKDLKNKRTESYSLSETLSLVPPSDIPTIPVSFHQHTAPVSASQSLVQGIQPQLTLPSSQPLAPNPACSLSDQSNRLLPEIQEPENTAPEYIDVNVSNLAFPLSPKEDTPSPPMHETA